MIRAVRCCRKRWTRLWSNRIGWSQRLGSCDGTRGKRCGDRMCFCGYFWINANNLLNQNIHTTKIWMARMESMFLRWEWPIQLSFSLLWTASIVNSLIRWVFERRKSIDADDDCWSRMIARRFCQRSTCWSIREKILERYSLPLS